MDAGIDAGTVDAGRPDLDQDFAGTGNRPRGVRLKHEHPGAEDREVDAAARPDAPRVGVPAVGAQDAQGDERVARRAVPEPAGGAPGARRAK